MNEKEYNDIQSHAKKHKYSYPFHHMEYGDYKDAYIMVHTDALALVVDKDNGCNNVYWFFDEPIEFLTHLKCLSGKIIMEFVPKELIDTFVAYGFTVYAEYIDFFNNNLPETAQFIADNSEIENICYEDKDACRQMSLLCIEQSRGFAYESEKWYMDWAKEHHIFAIRCIGEIIGYCCASIYANNTIVWVRRLAVSPQWQRKGIGEALLKQALLFGFQNGASRAFLHVDSDNEPAISLYRKFGFSVSGCEGQVIIQKQVYT